MALYCSAVAHSLPVRARLLVRDHVLHLETLPPGARGAATAGLVVAAVAAAGMAVAAAPQEAAGLAWDSTGRRLLYAGSATAALLATGAGTALLGLAALQSRSRRSRLGLWAAYAAAGVFGLLTCTNAPQPAGALDRVDALLIALPMWIGMAAVLTALCRRSTPRCRRE